LTGGCSESERLDAGLKRLPIRGVSPDRADSSWDET
jgi:hypothetical protein